MADGGVTYPMNYEPLRDGGSTFNINPAAPLQNSISSRYAKQRINKHISSYNNIRQHSLSSTGLPSSFKEIDILDTLIHLPMDLISYYSENEKEMLLNIEIDDEGKYSLSDEVNEYFYKEWKKLGFLTDTENEEDGLRLSRNLNVLSAYLYLKNPKTTYVKLNLSMMALPILIRTYREVKFDLYYPEKFWNWYLEWVRDNYDHFEKISNLRPIDMEAEICFRFSECLQKILIKEDPESETETQVS